MNSKLGAYGEGRGWQKEKMGERETDMFYALGRVELIHGIPWRDLNSRCPMYW